MAKPLHLTNVSLLLLRSRTALLHFPEKPRNFYKYSIFSSPSLFFSTTSTPYPLQYDMIINRPTKSSLTPTRVKKPDPEIQNPEAEPGLTSWVDEKLTRESETGRPGYPEEMDKKKRKYYSKRRKRMYGSDSEDENWRKEDGFVELQPEVVEFDRLHQREEELYFYDTFAYPWEKDKHYKMVYQLEKKYFPDQCLDKAFLQPGASNVKDKVRGNKEMGGRDMRKDEDDRKLVFFDENAGDKGRVEAKGKMSGADKRKEVVGGGGDRKLVSLEEEKKVDAKKDVTERKVEEFFKCLGKVPDKKSVVDGDKEPYLVRRNGELPAGWDGPNGTVVLVNKPKGWTSFTVCGKLRRLVKVKKVGHAGTLDPMATGLLIVCVGKATKLVDRYQGMIKGYSGVFRLGEATSTLDADSPVIQRELWEHIKDVDIKKAAAKFCGEIWQVPPMFSAIKVGGERMYEKARRGETAELSPRRISIYQFDIERSLDDRQNLIFRVTCSKGTYIRSLCADFGKALGSCAHLTTLRRDCIGEYSADDAWEFKELEEAITKNYF